jgi:hypothetical protein
VPIPKPTQEEKDKLNTLRAYQLENPTALSPCIDQTADDIRGYYKHVEVGGRAMVRQTQGHWLRYTPCRVEATKARSGRLYVEGFGGFYAKSGKNCFHPTGQTTLVVPTPEVLAWVALHPQGESDVSCWRIP